jgi:hypothetical protein
MGTGSNKWSGGAYSAIATLAYFSFFVTTERKTNERVVSRWGLVRY